MVQYFDSKIITNFKTNKTKYLIYKYELNL